MLNVTRNIHAVAAAVSLGEQNLGVIFQKLLRLRRVTSCFADARRK